MCKKIAILFSGGLDSCYLVWKNLKDGNVVQPIYIEIENNSYKTIIEKNRIKLLVEEFRKEFNLEEERSYDTERHIHNIQFTLKVDVHARENSLYFKQVPLWILACLFSQDLDVDEIQIGYVQNDDAVSYLEDIQNVYQSYKPLLRQLKPLVFPLSKAFKYEMIHELPKQYHKFIFSCEMPRIVGSENAEFIEYEPCCECTPCRRIIHDNFYDMEIPAIYNENLIQFYRNKVHKLGYMVSNADIKKIEYEKASQHLLPHQLKIDFDFVVAAPEKADLEYTPVNDFNG